MSTTILLAYDGSESSAAAIAAAGKLFEHDRRHAVVLTVWEPLTVEALSTARFAEWIPLPLDVTEVDERSEAQARELAEHGTRLAIDAGFEARAVWTADERTIGEAIVAEAATLQAALIVMGGHGLTGLAAFYGSVSKHVLRHASRPILVVPRAKSRSVAPRRASESAAAA
jgi:nucleotide-binding universal stress UspA family protein